MMKLLGAVFLFVGLECGGHGAVVSDFTNICDEFFFNRIPPTFNNNPLPDNSRQNDFRRICQVQKPNVKQYATLYDTKNRIPVYSAYKYETRPATTAVTRDEAWKIEPQLDASGNNIPDFMVTVRYSRIPMKDRGLHQALNKDYEHSSYDKGHLFPVNHAHDQASADGTFTLTNAAPQNCDFNKKWYSTAEHLVSEEINNKCPPDTAYIVTGVIPSENPGNFISNGRVNVPTHFWTAFCCVDITSKTVFSGSCVMSEKDHEATCGQLNLLNQFKIKPFGGNC